MTAVLLAVVTIVLILVGVFAFLNIRRGAKEEASKVAEITAHEITERVANRYLQEHLPEIIGAYADMMSNVGTATGSQANEIAEEESTET